MVLPTPPATSLRDHAVKASYRAAFGALLLRDLTVLRKNLKEFVPRTLIQPLLLMFVLAYVFPRIGQAPASGPAAKAYSTALVAGVIGLSILFQGILAVALPLVQEFGYTKEIEDRVLAPLPLGLVAFGKVVAGAIQGLIAAVIVFPIAAVVPATKPGLHVTWWVLLTLAPLAAVTTSSLGLFFGTKFDPRTVPSLFGVVVLPLTFLGGTYFPWTKLGAVKLGGFAWLKYLVLVNPLIYISEGFRAALTTSPHMSLFAIYPALSGFCALFLWQGIKGFKRRVLS